MSTWINPHCSHAFVQGADDVWADFEDNSIQAHSAPGRLRDNWRFERCNSGAVLQYAGSSLERESEPWSHLQTFALSAPEHNDQCSRDFQIEAISQWPSSLQDNEMLQPSTTESRHQHQPFAKHNRMQEIPYPAEGCRSQHSRLRNQARSAQDLQFANVGMLEHRVSHAGEQRMARSSTSSSFSQPTTSGLHIENQCFDFRSAYPLRNTTFDELTGRNIGLRQDLEVNGSLDSGLVDESGRSSLPASHSVMTPQELSWQQHDHHLFGHQLSTSVDTTYGSYDLGLTANDHAWPSDFRQDQAFGLGSCQTYDHSNTLDHPGAIRIEGSDGHCKSSPSSSLPPSADSFPDYMPPMQRLKPHRAIASTSQPTAKDSSKATSARGSRSRSGSLSIIREYGHSQQGSPIISHNGSAKGKRKGPLPTATALAAAQKRKDGNVCIRCRTMKMTCKGGLPCEGCRQITKVKLWDQPCTPANFIDMVKEGTCNAVFQHSISHLALDGSRRLVVPIPTAFNVSGILDRLNSCQLRYDIRVRHLSGSYTLNLSSCFRLLTKIQKSCRLETCELQDFVSNKHLRLAWLQSVREHDLTASVVDRSIQWNNMPSRNTYELSPHNKLALGRTLDVEDQQDRGTIIFAAQLSRIVLRALEMEAFEALQKSVNELTKGGKADADIGTLIGQLGQILMSLRWRVSWWAVVGDNPSERFTSRVTKLAQILYCYYFVARKKMTSCIGQLPSKIRSVYADVEPVYEDLPLTDSLDGFHAWMQKGQAVVQSARFQQNIARSLPTAPVNTLF